jgi:hypothetical protein
VTPISCRTSEGSILPPGPGTPHSAPQVPPVAQERRAPPAAPIPNRNAQLDRWSCATVSAPRVPADNTASTGPHQHRTTTRKPTRHSGRGLRRSAGPPRDIPYHLTATETPDHVSDDQTATPTLRPVPPGRRAIWRAYTLREALRAIFAPRLGYSDVEDPLDRFAAKASRSAGMNPSSLWHGPSPGTGRHPGRERVESEETPGTRPQPSGAPDPHQGCRLHSTQPAQSLVMLTIGPVTHVASHEQRATDP